jgi:thiosulfate/3-mercaptopyruvate sulfurtransferase
VRVLLVGGGCRGLALVGEIVADGHAVRAVTRDERNRPRIEEAGAECWIGDPDVVGTLRYALENATILVWALGTAAGTPEQVAALHGPRLEMMLSKTIDTTVRGVVYEAAGTVAADTLATGVAVLRRTCERNEIPYAVLRADPAQREAWVAGARRAIGRLLVSRLGSITAFQTGNGTRLSGGDHVGDYSKDVLVETDWVAEHLDDDSIRIVEVDENPALYAEAHIPGAIGFDWQTDLQDQVKRDFLGPEEFGELFGSRGISNDHTIVLYGDRNNWFAAYTYWYLKYYGHDKVLLVNGPREKWISEGRETSSEVPSYEPATFSAQPGDDAIRAKRDEVLAALDTSTKLVDVRSPQEYSGELIAMTGYEQEGAQRGGHIPGAASIPWAQAVTPEGTFKSRDELEELYGGKGVLSGDPIIAYCRIGERSAHSWFVLHELLGRDDVKNYDGSWTEWGNLVNVPIEKNV